MTFPELFARLSNFSLSFSDRVYSIYKCLLTGFWLGILSEKSLDIADEHYYNIVKGYQTEAYNSSGLFRWEKQIIEEYFSDQKNILIVAAGGGREAYALIKMGFYVDSYECNKQLAIFGNNFFRLKGLESKISYLPRGAIPSTNKVYDALILGWGAYSLIRGKENRIKFLKDLSSLSKDRSMLMISFLTRNGTSRKDILIFTIANLFRLIQGRGKIEIGDNMQNNFAHFFLESEIVAEISQANYKLLKYYDLDYGCALAECNR